MLYIYEKIAEVECPHCKKSSEVKFIRFGYGYIGHCKKCSKIVCLSDKE